MIATRAIVLAALVGFVCGALFGGIGAWRWQASTIKDIKLEYSDALVTAMMEADRARLVEAERIQGVNDVRADELATIAAKAAGRPATVIRVCNTPVPAAPSGQDADASGQPTPTAGGVQQGHGESAGTDYDTSPLYAIAKRCDDLSADYRALYTAWPK